MPASTPARRPLVVATAAVAVLALSACGSNASSATAAKDNPYGLQQAGTIRVGHLDRRTAERLPQGREVHRLRQRPAHRRRRQARPQGASSSAPTSPRSSPRSRTSKFDVGSSSITITDARKKTVDFTNGYDFGYFGLDVPDGLRHHGLRPAEGQARRGRAGHGPGRLRHREGLEPGAGPRLQRRAEPAEGRHGRRLDRPRRDRREDRQADSGGKVTVAAKQLSPAPRRSPSPRATTALREALNKGLDEVIEDGTWTRLQEQYYPGRPIPTDFTPGSGTVAVRARGRPVDHAPTDRTRRSARWTS